MRKTVFSKRSSLLGIPPESDSARLGHIPSLPWESQLPLKPCPIFTTFSFSRQLRFFRFSLRFLLHFIVQFCYLLRKCGLLAHTSPTFLKNCWIKKLFILPAARILQPLPASPKNFPFCAFLPLSAFPPHFLFPSHASCTFSSNASALYPLFIAKYLINPLRFSSKLLLSKRIFATFQRQS